jgi:hypothetical protein
MPCRSQIRFQIRIIQIRHYSQRRNLMSRHGILRTLYLCTATSHTSTRSTACMYGHQSSPSKYIATDHTATVSTTVTLSRSYSAILPRVLHRLSTHPLPLPSTLASGTAGWSLILTRCHRAIPQHNITITIPYHTLNIPHTYSTLGFRLTFHTAFFTVIQVNSTTDTASLHK